VQLLPRIWRSYWIFGRKKIIATNWQLKNIVYNRL